jgi:hypothetical protein
MPIIFLFFYIFPLLEKPCTILSIRENVTNLSQTQDKIN